MGKILIDVDYWSGEGALDHGYPWLVPAAIIHLDNILNKDKTVLEFGSGGSTIFFGYRCGKVTSFETNFDWYSKVSDKIKSFGLSNINYNLIKNDLSLLEIPFCDILNQNFDLVNIDCDPKVIDRMHLIRKYKHLVKRGGYLLLDNYGAFGCQNSDSELKGWDIWWWNDLHWWGNGTKLYRRPL